MIYQIKGVLTPLNSEKVLVESASGIGYEVLVSNSSLFKISSGETTIYTSFQVREDSQTLYGFASLSDKELFERLLSVSGIGPKVAMSVLRTYIPQEVYKLIADGDFKALSKVVGLGQKGAKKIIVDLQGKIDLSQEASDAEGKAAHLSNLENPLIAQLRDALKSLGFKGNELAEMVEQGEGYLSVNDSLSIEQLVQRVLKG